VDTDAVNLAIFMSGTGSNTEKILERFAKDLKEGEPKFLPKAILVDNLAAEKNAGGIIDRFREKVDADFEIKIRLNNYEEFKNKHIRWDKEEIRQKYDNLNAEYLYNNRVNLVALAGYNLIIKGEGLLSYVILNVHPGDLRVRNKNDERKYVGLAWVPSAKAILNGEIKGHSSVHLVTPEVDEGPLLAVSKSQYLDMDHLANITKLCGDAENIKGIKKYIRDHPEVGGERLGKMFPVYGIAKDLQERLKVNGDWVIFPETIVRVANKDYKKDKEGNIYYKDKQITEDNIDKLVLF
jgi:folate-dependent phosphoribosylglycinamide formyltransferase PurN